MKKENNIKSGKKQRKQEKRRIEASARNAKYALLPLEEKKKRNPKKFE